MGKFFYNLFKGIGLIAVIKDSKTTDAAKYDQAMMALENEMKAKKSGEEPGEVRPRYPDAHEFGGALLAIFGMEILLTVAGLLTDIANTYSGDRELTILKIGLGVITGVLCLVNALLLFSVRKFEKRFALSGIFQIVEALFTVPAAFLLNPVPLLSFGLGCVAFLASLAALVFFVNGLIHSIGTVDRPVGNSLRVFLTAYFISRGLILAAELVSVPFESIISVLPPTLSEAMSLIFLIVVIVLVFCQLIVYVWKMILLWECVVFLIND